MKQFLNTLMVALVLTLVAHVLVTAQTDPEELLESGVYKEEVEGELEQAIEIFERLVRDFSQNRSVAARALLHLGSSYEKLGNLKAGDTYQRLINDFGDQQAMVSEARMRLQMMRYKALAEGIQNQSDGPTYCIALDEDAPGSRPLAWRQFDFSPSGDQIVYQTWEGLFVSDASGTLRRQLVAEGDDPKGWSVTHARNGQARWSPDGMQIAYFAAKRKPPGDDPNKMIWTIFVIDAEGGKPRLLAEQLYPRPFGSLCWTPDGTNLTYIGKEGAISLDLEGNKVGLVELGGDHRSTTLTGYSPDGRWLVLTMKADEESGNNLNTDVYLKPSGGGNAVQLTFISGYDCMPVWSRDNRSVYFVSDRSAEKGSSNIWKVNVNSQTGQPLGDPEQVTFFKDARITHPRVVGKGDRIAFLLDKTKNSIHVAPDGQPENYRALARGIKPVLSPDGKFVYYIGEGPDQQGIHSVPVGGGQPKRLTITMPVSDEKDLSPDGKTLAYFGDADNRRGLYTLAVEGGQPRLLHESDCEECCKSVHWSPDGKSLTYNSGDGLYLISSTGGEPKKLATLKGWESWTISWSPDGKLIAALGYQEGEENNAVYVVPAAGGAPRLISDFDEYKEGLEWHPDGQRLTYHESKSKSDTRMTYLDGRPPELFLDKDDSWDYIGRWSPDGDRYFFSGFRDAKTSCVDIYHVNTGEFSIFSDDAASLPTWSGDQKTMVWTVERKISQLWLMENFK